VDPIPIVRWWCGICAKSFCQVHWRAHDVSHPLTVLRAADEHSRALGQAPLVTQHFSVLSFMDHRVDALNPHNASMTEYFPEWAGAWPHGPWLTLQQMSIDENAEIVKRYYGIPVDNEAVLRLVLLVLSVFVCVCAQHTTHNTQHSWPCLDRNSLA
jgi:hypothetical protein